MFARFIPIIISLTTFIAWEFLILKPQSFFYSLAVVAAACVLVLHFNSYQIFDKNFLLLIIPVVCLEIFTTLYFIFLNNIYLQHGIAVLAATGLFYYYTYLYYFLRRITSYKPLTLESASSYSSVVSYLFFSTIIFGLMIFLNMRSWYLALIVIIVTFFSAYQFFWINKIEQRLCFFASIVVSVVMVEFFWSITFFSVTHFISGLSLAIIYYIILNLTLLYLLERLDKKVLQTYLSIGLSCVAIILLSAKWL
ncbi:MAG: hypothetical protein Q8Q23_04350 [bacterium]|nr:hypothetical protein [bacterium]